MLWRPGPRRSSATEAATGRQRRLFAPLVPRLRLSPSRGLCCRNSPCLYALSSHNDVSGVVTAPSDMQPRLFSLVPAGLLSVLLAWCLVPLAKADCTCHSSTYLIYLMDCWACVDWNITEPANGVVWTNGQTNLISWSKALDDGVSQFDIELQRLSTSGLSYIAHLGTLPIYLAACYITDLRPLVGGTPL